jgi:GNAT superfamily N-acetyltransferase
MPNPARYNVLITRGRYRYELTVRPRHCEITVSSASSRRTDRQCAYATMTCRAGYVLANTRTAAPGIITEEGRVAGIDEVRVFPRYKRKGIGRELARLLLGVAQRWGSPACYLHAHWHEETSGFWAKFGFVIVGKDKDGFAYMKREICPGAFIPIDDGTSSGVAVPLFNFTCPPIDDYTELPPLPPGQTPILPD